MRLAKVPTSGSRGSSRHGDHLAFPVCDDLATLTWLVNLAALELHVHQWTVGRNGQPRNADRIVIDLDPGEPAGLHECCQVALLARDALGERGLDVLPVTSGSKGLHLYAPLPRRRSSEDTSALAREVAEELQAAHPRLVTATMTKARRGGKVFLDWSQNAASKTTVSPYSLRGRERPRVAAPVTWAEVEEGADDPLGLEMLGPDGRARPGGGARGPVLTLSDAIGAPGDRAGAHLRLRLAACARPGVIRFGRYRDPLA